MKVWKLSVKVESLVLEHLAYNISEASIHLSVLDRSVSGRFREASSSVSYSDKPSQCKKPASFQALDEAAAQNSVIVQLLKFFFCIYLFMYLFYIYAGELFFLIYT